MSNASIKLEDFGNVIKRGMFYKWIIPNFSTRCKKAGDFLASPVFDNWQLKIYPYGNVERSEKYISIFLCNLRDEKVIAECNISLLTRTEEISNNVKTSQKGEFNVTGTDFDNRGLSIPRDFVMDPIRGLLVDDELIIQCEIFVDDNQAILTERYKQQLNLTLYESYRLKEIDMFEKFFDAGEATDVTFVVKEEKISAHKAFLMARSPVFAAMFTQDMEESKQIVVEDISPAVFKEMLRFIYVAKVNNIEEIGILLMLAADKYSIDGLKKLCENAIACRLTLDNALDMIKFADLQNAENLKSIAMNFIKVNSSEIVKQIEFKNLMEKNRDLVCEIMCEIANAYNKERKKRKLD